MISLKDYAKQNNVSYEAVRQQVIRYKKELGNHLIKSDRQQLLDDQAVAFLDAKRSKNPVVIVNQDKDQRIEELEKENKELLIKIALQADKISELSDWKADQALAIAAAEHNRILLEQKNEEIEELKKSGKENEIKLKNHYKEELDERDQKHQEELEAEKRRRLTWKEAIKRVFV